MILKNMKFSLKMDVKFLWKESLGIKPPQFYKVTSLNWLL